MLAMMSCVFDPSRPPPEKRQSYAQYSKQHLPSSDTPVAYHSSLDTALSLSSSPVPSNPPKPIGVSHSTTSSAGNSILDQTEISSESLTPPSYILLHSTIERRSSQTTSLSASPEHQRGFRRSGSNLSGLGSSFSRPFSFISSAASSPPNAFARKKPSPSGSYLGVTSSNATWTTASNLSKSSIVREGLKGSLNLSISDSEGDTDSAAHKKVPTFTTHLKNQAYFHDEGRANITLLKGSADAQCFAYREAYAQMLDVWQLPIARCEMLKFNGNILRENPSSRILGRDDTRTVIAALNESPSLEVMQVCYRCQGLLPPSSKSFRCPQCYVPKMTPACVFCHISIRGLMSPCQSCGHVLHQQCRQELLQSRIDECPTGCGCTCFGHPFVELSYSSSKLTSLHQDDNQYRLRPSRGTASTRDVSPAITIVADTDNRSSVHHEPSGQQRPREWRRNSDFAASPLLNASHNRTRSQGEKTEGADVAYESLARNLWAGIVRGGGAGAGAGGGNASNNGRSTPVPGGIARLREKGSQIWRGG